MKGSQDWKGIDLKVERTWPLAGMRVNKEEGQWGGSSVSRGLVMGTGSPMKGRGRKMVVVRGREYLSCLWDHC